MSFLYKILQTPAASGLEEQLANLLKTELGDGYTDENGTFIYHKKGEGKSVIFAAAMDSPSLFVTHRGDDGFVRFCANGIDFKKLCGQTVRFPDNSGGVIYAEKDKENVTDFFIDTFGKGANEADSATLQTPLVETENTLTAFDIGRAAIIYSMVKAAKEIEGKDIYFVFLAKTIGNRHSAAFSEGLPHDAELVFIDKSAANDYPGERDVFVKLGGGVCIRAMDKSIVSSKSLFDSAARLDNIKIQKEISQRRHAGSILQKEFTGFKALSVGIPTRYIDKICETVSKNDIAELVKFILFYSNEERVISK